MILQFLEMLIKRYTISSSAGLNSRGSAILILVMTFALLGATGYFLNNITSLQKDYVNKNIYHSAIIIRDNIGNILHNQNAWNLIKARGQKPSPSILPIPLVTDAPLPCLMVCGGCPAAYGPTGTPVPLTIPNLNRALTPPLVSWSETNPFFNPDKSIVTPMGFGLDGSPCKITTLSGDDNCPFQVKISWLADGLSAKGCCPGNTSITGTCVMPTMTPQPLPVASVNIYIEIAYKPKDIQQAVTFGPNSGLMRGRTLDQNEFILTRPY